MPLMGELWPIPIATSTSNKTMLLDSNHTILNIIKSQVVNMQIPIARIRGSSMEDVIDDFKILNQQID